MQFATSCQIDEAFDCCEVIEKYINYRIVTIFMSKPIEFTAKEESFLRSMDLSDSEESDRYRGKYGCDPCDACGPSSCSDCKACVEGDDRIGSNPFDSKYKLLD
jgi:hypothetical protein